MQEQEQDRGSKTLDLMSRESTNGRIAYLLLTQFEILEIPISFVFCSSHDYITFGDLWWFYCCWIILCG